MVQTLIFAQGQTREGMKWTINDASTNKPVDLTGAVVNVLVYDAVDRSTIIVQDIAEILNPSINGQAQYLFSASQTARAGTYEVELNQIIFADASIGILDDMRIVIKPVGPG